MAKRTSFSEVSIDVASRREETPEVPEPEAPFRVAILGDFSGRSNRGLREPLASRRPVLIDRDNFNEVLAKSGVQLNLNLAGDAGMRFVLRLAELDDFHPDRIFERVELFRGLREAREKLANPETFGAAAREMGVVAASSPPPADSRASAPPDPDSLVSGSLLDTLIEQTEVRPTEPRPSRAPDELMEFVRRIVEPHLVPGSDPRQLELIDRVDRAISDAMRALLRYRDFQALEAAWRGVDLLVRRVETGTQLKLFLIDISKAELAADLLASDDLSASGAYRLLVEKTVGTPGAGHWSVLVGNYTFEPTLEDVELLRRLALVGAAAGAPLLAAASPRLLGCASLADSPDPRDWRLDDRSEGAQAWRLFRRLPEARWAGLALPRFLLRLPYGCDTDPIERFNFEEISGAPVHEGYLWGNPAFACALLLARAFSDYGWDLRPGVYSEIDGLPLHVYKEDGEPGLKPCAEVLLTEDAAERILEQGLMPLVSLKDRDAVRLVRFQSVADPPRNLSGPWG